MPFATSFPKSFPLRLPRTTRAQAGEMVATRGRFTQSIHSPSPCRKDHADGMRTRFRGGLSTEVVFPLATFHCFHWHKILFSAEYIVGSFRKIPQQLPTLFDSDHVPHTLATLPSSFDDIRDGRELERAIVLLS
jgi:hypothetical protein